jgi:hypothetical protein
MSIAPRRLRTRLTLWYVGTLAAVLALYLVGVSLLLVWQMDGVLKKLAAEDLETVKGLLYFQPDGQVGVREDYHHHTDWKQVQERFLEILAPNGAVLYRNARLGDRALGGQPFAGEGENGYSGRTVRLSDRTRVVLISRKYDLQGQTILIRAGYDEDLIWTEVKGTLLVLILASPLVFAGTAYAGYKMVGRTLEPVTKMANRAEQIVRRNSRRRAGASGAGVQRNARANRAIVRTVASLHRGRVARVAHSAGRNAKYRRSATGKSCDAGGISRHDRQHAGRG